MAISRARELVAKPVTGEQSELVDCVRAAEAALQQASSMLDAVDSAASDIAAAAIRRTVMTLTEDMLWSLSESMPSTNASKARLVDLLALDYLSLRQPSRYQGNMAQGLAADSA